MWARGWRVGVGLAVGALTAVCGVVPLLLVLGLPWSGRARRAVGAAVGIERLRVGAWLGGAPVGGVLRPGPAARYLAVRVPVGLLGGAVLALLGAGTAFAATVAWSWLTGTPWLSDPDATMTGPIVAVYTVPGLVLLFLGLAGAARVAELDRVLLRRLDAPTAGELRERVDEVVASRDAVLAAVDDERHRIERDLHDGVQQRLVALGMLIGRARRHPGRDDLLAQAHEEAQRALADLRDVSWRVHPAALETAGLAAALEAVAERAPVPVQLSCDLPAEPPAAERAVAWFVVCEAVTNAAKHAGATRVLVEIVHRGTLRVAITDDGCGGADPAGGGLTGLARRVAAADGTFGVDSPPGGPTVVRAELPCA